MLSCSVFTSPPWYGPPDPGSRHNVPPLGYSRLLAFHICLLFPHCVKLFANTMQLNTTCHDYDSISQHSHQSTRTTGPQKRPVPNHDHAQGAGGGGATLEHIQIFNGVKSLHCLSASIARLVWKIFCLSSLRSSVSGVSATSKASSMGSWTENALNLFIYNTLFPCTVSYHIILCYSIS